MPASVQSARGSQKFSAILAQIKSRIVNGALDATSANVQIVAAPDDDMADYLATPGYRVRIEAPNPSPMCGAGRNGYLTERRFDVYVVSVSLQDPGGQDDAAVLAHCDREESLVNVMNLDPPVQTTAGTPVGRLVKWMPGGQTVRRLLQDNPGTIVSRLPFVVTYTPPNVVYRD